MLWYATLTFSPWDPPTKPINTPCRTQITRGATQPPLCTQLLALSLAAFPAALQTADTAQPRAKVVYWQRCTVSPELQTAALTHPDKEALIGPDIYVIYNSPPCIQVLGEPISDLLPRRDTG